MQEPLSEPLLLWIVLAPLLGAVINGLLGPRLPRSLVMAVATATLPISLYVALSAAFGKASSDALIFERPWLNIADFHVSARLVLDPLSLLFVGIITGVGTLIHIFSWDYMREEPAVARYFSYLNLFCAAMLLLVMADTLPLMFVGWEGVGLASYLLIGFHYHEAFRVQAGTKAFIFNRVGDAALLIAMFVLCHQTSALGFIGIREAVAIDAVPASVATACVLLMGLAVAGKSAQLPLFVWLPDAMAGPTPVSALIHAATMVTAGVYLLARLASLVVLSPFAMATLGLMGAATALVAAICACVQDDIKRVLAYSTVSQLGYMVMAAATGQAPLALFHVTTHAFFKACLFLAAAAVIHAQSGEQDMRRMGGLGPKMPMVALCFGISTLALCGVPPLSGFVSKDAILSHLEALATTTNHALSPAAQLMWPCALLTALLTAFYMGRTMLLVFFSGSYRGPSTRAAHLHDASGIMALPLAALAALSLIGGLLSWPHVLGGHAWLVTSLQQVIATLPEPPQALSDAQELRAMGVSSGLALAGLGWAYLATRLKHSSVCDNPKVWRDALAQSFGIDALYRVVFKNPYQKLATRFFPRWVEHAIIGGVPRVLCRLTQATGFGAQLLHSGNLQRGLAVLVMALALMLYGWLLPNRPFSASAPSEASAMLRWPSP